MEAAVFVAFVVLQAVFANGPHWFSHCKRCVWVQKLSDNHYLVWVFHPVVLHGVKDYAVHFVVYSGHVIGGH